MFPVGYILYLCVLCWLKTIKSDVNIALKTNYNEVNKNNGIINLTMKCLNN